MEEHWVAWTNPACPCLLVTHNGMKTTVNQAYGDFFVHTQGHGHRVPALKFL